MLDYFVVGPTKRTQRFYAGYAKPSEPKIFVPMASCTSERQAKDACETLKREAKKREQAVFSEKKEFARWIPVKGFYEDDE